MTYPTTVRVTFFSVYSSIGVNVLKRILHESSLAAMITCKYMFWFGLHENENRFGHMQAVDVHCNLGMRRYQFMIFLDLTELRLLKRDCAHAQYSLIMFSVPEDRFCHNRLIQSIKIRELRMLRRDRAHILSRLSMRTSPTSYLDHVHYNQT